MSVRITQGRCAYIGAFDKVGKLVYKTIYLYAILYFIIDYFDIIDFRFSFASSQGANSGL